MRITRLYLRNYRVFEEPLEIELPPGLVGLFGPNGAGKSTLLEGILWSLWGRARTPKDGIRTSGVNADCISEVEFEHEGHLYAVRRTISGVNHTVRAQAYADGAQVAEGVRDVGSYVHSVLGMDDVAFRASVFAEQKQLAAFSSHAPAERRKLVMQLLGITPLDGARDQARRDAREAADQLGRMRSLLPDRADIQAQLTAAAEEAARAAADAGTAREAEERARTAREAAELAHRRLADVGGEHEALVREGKAVRVQRDRADERVARLDAELAELAGAGKRVVELEPLVAGLAAGERGLGLVEAAAAAAGALARTPEPPAPPAPDADAADRARRDAEAAAARLGELEGRQAAAGEAVKRARGTAARSAELSGQEDCPMCGQALGEAFERVQQHRAEELAQAEEALRAVTADREAAAVAAGAAARAAHQALAALDAARKRWSDYERARERHRAAAETFAEALAALRDAGPDVLGCGDGPEVFPEVEAGAAGAVLADWHERLARRVQTGRQAAEECARLRGRLERRDAAAAELAEERGRVADLDSELENLRDKVRALAFSPEELAAAERAAGEVRTAWESAEGAAREAAARAAAAAATVDERRRRLADAEEQHARLAEAEEHARHLSRLAELLSAFRNTVVAAVGPRLSAQAAELFGELTDREYEGLLVDPDTYEIQVVDRAVAYGMDRFSGSETDLANLALRVAISEQVRFQSGGAVGLLVLDEVFGPLDEDRKERMLLALERLRGRFRQVLVVTHDAAIKEQMPGAIEVVKLPGRRATARLVNT